MSDHSAAFDHLIHWVEDLDSAMAAYDNLGLPTRAALSMPGFRNAAWGVDDERYVELATVDDWQAVPTSKYARGLELLGPAIDAVSGSGPVTFGVNVPDARATAARLRAAGHDIVEDAVRFEEQNAGFVEVYVRDVPPYFPFFITYDPPRAEIARMRAEYRATEGITFDGSSDLIALLARSDDPEADAHRLAELVGCPVSGSTVDLPGAEVRFERGAPSGLYGIAVRGLDPSTGPVGVAGLEVRAAK